MFGKRPRFLMDEDIDPVIAKLLPHLKYNTKTVSEIGLKGHPDENVYAYAWKHTRIIITRDKGFLDDRRFPPHSNPGVIVLPGVAADSRAFVGSLRAALDLVGPLESLWRGTKIQVGEDGVLAVTNRNVETGAIEPERYRFTKGRVPERWSG